MKMKKYNAPSIAAAMQLIRTELGEDAVILSSKVVYKKKFFGLLKEKAFEVVAGVDAIETRTPPATLSQPVSTRLEKAPKEVIPAELKQELVDLKVMMQSLQREKTKAAYPKEWTAFLNYLKHQELDEELITSICDELLAHSEKLDGSLTDLAMRQIAATYLTKRLAHLPIEGLTYKKKYINVLGPTGVGKTTTIAKMAARAVLENKKKIGFITTDTYRIAAIEQLKTYAGLLQAPIEIVYNADDYQKAIHKLSHLDLVFIDTAGRNYKEAKYVEDLRQLINFDEDVASYLVLSLTAKEKDLELIIEQFKEVAIQQFIFTKLDETNSIGTMFNLMIKYNKGVAYYTNGQEVPEDIEQPTTEKLFEMFFQGEYK